VTEIALLTTTGFAQVDQVVREIIGLVEPKFAGRVRGYYLVGSYAVGEPLAASDIDLIILFKGELEPAEHQQFGAIRDQCRQISPIALDLALESEARLLRVGGVWFQTASLLMYGEDVRARIPRKPVADHMRDLMHSTYPLLARVRGSPEILTFPLDYPDPAGVLYGYDHRYRDAVDSRRTVTKDLVTNVLAAANALTLLQAGQYAGSGKKSDIPRQYRIWVGDEWAGLVDQVFESCRGRWGYLMPEDTADRDTLRGLCQQALRFENRYLARFKDFLLEELRHSNEGTQLFAARRLGEIIYRDAAVVAALEDAGRHGDAELRQVVDQTLRRMRGVEDAAATAYSVYHND
jgi:predicted nucleotidyltransferase